MILYGLWIYFKLNFFHLDKTAKKGYNSYNIFPRKKFRLQPWFVPGLFFMIIERSSIYPECPAPDAFCECRIAEESLQMLIEAQEPTAPASCDL